jgi:hypothetical protein
METADGDARALAAFLDAAPAAEVDAAILARGVAGIRELKIRKGSTSCERHSICPPCFFSRS